VIFVAQLKLSTMANKSITMIQIRRILQLLSEGVSKHKIAGLLTVHRATIEVYVLKFASTGKTFTELLQLEDYALAELLSTISATAKNDTRLAELDKLFGYIKQELQRVGVTRQLLWQEYITTHPAGYSYTQFCEHLSRHLKISKATMHLTHQPAEYLQVDFAGKQLHYIDAQTGEIIQCPILICTLPFSSYTYVEALASAKQEHFVAALNRCLEYLGGVPRNILSDNMKQYVQKNDRYEYTFTELLQKWSVHYNTNLDATRPRKPKDKPSVENSVYVSYLRIYAKLRNREFFSLSELNQGIISLLTDYNQTMFQKYQTSRSERFNLHEKALLKPLPGQPFTVKRISTGKVQMNYHVVQGEDMHQYSVPYQYIGQKTTITYDTKTVEVFIGLSRIALHTRSYRRNGYSTQQQHMPQGHLCYMETLGWDADYFLGIASKIGVNATEVFKMVLASRDFVEQTYKACVGLKRLSEIYHNNRFEAACQRALKGTRINYTVIKNILKNNLDLQQPCTQMQLFDIPLHDNIRGSDAYK